jgi:hypothetical protein
MVTTTVGLREGLYEEGQEKLGLICAQGTHGYFPPFYQNVRRRDDGAGYQAQAATFIKARQILHEQ